jgi:hypothetical protein
VKNGETSPVLSWRWKTTSSARNSWVKNQNGPMRVSPVSVRKPPPKSLSSDHFHISFLTFISDWKRNRQVGKTRQDPKQLDKHKAKNSETQFGSIFDLCFAFLANLVFLGALAVLFVCYSSDCSAASAFRSGRMCGKRITSRIDWRLVSSITKRSMPMPIPAAGGMP